MTLYETTANSPRQLVINGELAAQERYPYFALVGDYCGGSLIAPDIVLTAGHCKTHHKLEIRIHPSSRSQVRQVFHSVLQVRHPDFEWRGEDDFSNDFLVVKLSEPSFAHQIARLSKEQIDSRDIIAMGMGWTNRFRPSRAERLHSVALQSIPNTVCEAARGRNMTYEGRIDESMMCTTVSSNCDSGSPLILPGDQFDTIVGMVSWGMECADPYFPAVNARISSSYEWIRGTTCGLSQYPPTYLCGTTRQQESTFVLYALAVAIASYYGWKLWVCRGNTKQRYSSIAEATVMNA